MAFGGVLIRIALGTQKLLVFGGEGLVHQRALALEAVETFFMPVTVFVGQILNQRELQDTSMTSLFKEPENTFSVWQALIRLANITYATSGSNIILVLSGHLETKLSLQSIGLMQRPTEVTQLHSMGLCKYTQKQDIRHIECHLPLFVNNQ